MITTIHLRKVMCGLIPFVFLLLLGRAPGFLSAVEDRDLEILQTFRRDSLKDPFRPSWHLALPEGYADPFDPNAAVYKDGLYHLWYIYQTPTEKRVNRWAHVSSLDLFHWRWHSFELKPEADTPEKGINSGNALTLPDGRVAISYQGVQAAGKKAGHCLAYSSDSNLDKWTRSPNNPTIIPIGDTYLWYENNRYYLLSSGVIPTLYSGDTPDETMKPIGPLMPYNMPDVASYEDCSCPEFFKLGNKWVLLGISHPKGARYYIGNWDGKQFTPESHHRMNWAGGCCFAPETLCDASGRRIFWAWLRNDESAKQVTVLSMPRILTLAEDGKSLNINPPQEIETLRYQHRKIDTMTISAGESVCLPTVQGKSLELDVLIDPKGAKRFGIKVFSSRDGREETPILIDLEKQTATIDLKKQGLSSVKYHEYFLYRDPNPEVTEQKAPIFISPEEKVRLRIFLDKSVLEVFINESQCISQLVYPTLPESQSVVLFAEDSAIEVQSVNAWKLFPTNPW